MVCAELSREVFEMHMLHNFAEYASLFWLESMEKVAHLYRLDIRAAAFGCFENCFPARLSFRFLADEAAY
tara:strand:+ start:269 stop:478 length:210 start_codon:yes stop_codon:yes gene_type:complete